MLPRTGWTYSSAWSPGSAAERTGPQRRGVVHGQQGAHIDADQFRRRHTDEVGERTVHPHDVVRPVVHHDEIADGVEDFHPVSVGPIHAGEKAGILQSDGGGTGDGLQKLFIFPRHRPAAIGQAQHPDQVTRGLEQTHQDAVAPAESRRQIGPQQLAGGRRHDTLGVARQRFGQGVAETA